MDPPPLLEDYIKHSIEHSLGLAVPDATLRVKLLASEEASRRLRDRLFLLEDRLHDREKRLEQWKAEAATSARGLRRCVEEKEAMAARCAELASRCGDLEKECALYDRDVERLMDSCDELARENEELKARLEDASDAVALVEEIRFLRKDKENLRINLLRAEEEVKLLSEENDQLDRDNRKLLRRLKKERDNHEFHENHSGGASSKGKRKSFVKKNETNDTTMFPAGTIDPSREPLSPLQQNSDDDLKKHRK